MNNAFSLAAKHILCGLGLGQFHEGVFGTRLNIRTRLVHDLTRQPLGKVIDGGTGKYKKGFVEEITLQGKIWEPFRICWVCARWCI